MNKILTVGMAAMTLATGVMATATPAAARDGFHGGYGGYAGRGYGHGDGVGAAVAGGIIGLALGAAISSHDRGYSYAPPPPAYGYDQPYADPAYEPGPYGVCVSRQTIWDPYRGGYVVRRVSHPC